MFLTSVDWILPLCFGLFATSFNKTCADIRSRVSTLARGCVFFRTFNESSLGPHYPQTHQIFFLSNIISFSFHLGCKVINAGGLFIFS